MAPEHAARFLELKNRAQKKCDLVALTHEWMIVGGSEEEQYGLQLVTKLGDDEQLYDETFVGLMAKFEARLIEEGL